MPKGNSSQAKKANAAVNVFWASKETRWPRLQSNAKQATIGKFIDDAMVVIEKENPTHNGQFLTSARYVGAQEAKDDGEPFEKKMKRPISVLKEQIAQASQLDKAIWADLKELAYGG